MLKKSLFCILFFLSGLAFLIPTNSVKAANVNQKAYDYELVDQQPSVPITMDPGETKTFWLELKNTGTETWNNYDKAQNPVSLGTGSIYDPENRGHDYADYFINDIISENSSVNRVGYFSDGVQSLVIIKSGWNVRIQFQVKAPYTPGIYREYFTPVVDGITWMKDIGIYWEITVTDQWQNKTIDLYNNQILLKSKVGDTVRVHSDDIHSLTYDASILQYTAPSNYCYNSVNCQTVYDFQIIGSGFTGISGNNFYSSIIADRNYYYYDAGLQQKLNGAKNGDIVIVRIQNVGNRADGMFFDKGYLYDNPILSSQGIKMKQEKNLVPISRMVGDIGLMNWAEEQWVFEVLDVNANNNITIKTAPDLSGFTAEVFTLNIK
ncbi:MAG TPA: hypothetical protein P5096_00850 [Patescibacteria group bacterium]|nr:hypothetical protein [Patescibacteria group bacterium]